MNRITLGVLCGLGFGLLDAALMLPMSFPDKRVAILGAFLDRFAIGFLICVVDLPPLGWASGLIVALLVSLPSAVVTKAYAPYDDAAHRAHAKGRNHPSEVRPLRL